MTLSSPLLAREVIKRPLVICNRLPSSGHCNDNNRASDAGLNVVLLPFYHFVVFCFTESNFTGLILATSVSRHGLIEQRVFKNVSA